MSERPLKTLQDFPTSKLNIARGAASTLQIPTISECRYRWLRVPATTFIITHSPPRSDHRGGLNFLRARVQPRGRPRPNIDFLVPVERIEVLTFGLQHYRSMAGCEYSQVFSGPRTCSGRCRRAGRRSPSGTVKNLLYGLLWLL